MNGKERVDERTPKWTADGEGVDLAAPACYAGERHVEVWREARRVHPIALLEAASRIAIAATLGHAGIRYRRISPDQRPRAGNQRPSHVIVENLADGSLTNLTIAEDEAFWAWAVIETLRHTGIRIEELLELTQFAIVSHRLADTGELVPLLQIVPSKTNEERLLLVTPELASVLAAIISRIRNPDGTVPLVAICSHSAYGYMALHRTASRSFDAATTAEVEVAPGRRS